MQLEQWSKTSDTFPQMTVKTPDNDCFLFFTPHFFIQTYAATHEREDERPIVSFQGSAPFSTPAAPLVLLLYAKEPFAHKAQIYVQN